MLFAQMNNLTKLLQENNEVHKKRTIYKTYLTKIKSAKELIHKINENDGIILLDKEYLCMQYKKSKQSKSKLSKLESDFDNTKKYLMYIYCILNKCNRKKNSNGFKPRDINSSEKSKIIHLL